MLSRAFYTRRSPSALAHDLLGKHLVCNGKAGRIVETEAYLGPEDQASHARFGVTRRNALMFGPGGFAYVYLIYGMHDMFNVIAGTERTPGAVLVRAVELVDGFSGADARAAAGPGKLCRLFGIERVRHDGTDLTASPTLHLTDGRLRRSERVSLSPRVGVDYAGEWATRPLRFSIAGHPAVSR